MGRLNKGIAKPLSCSKCGGIGRREHRVWKISKGYVHEGRTCTTCNGFGILPSR